MTIWLPQVAGVLFSALALAASRADRLQPAVSLVRWLGMDDLV